MKNEVMKNQELISDYKVDADYVEPTFADFVSRRTFINRTGVFVSPSYFWSIHDDFKKSGVSVDEFLDNFQKYNFEVVEVPMTGSFKCCVSDDIVSGIGVYKEEDHEANVLEALNVATLSSYHNRKYAEHAIGVYKRNMKENRLRNAESNGVH